ncbi:Adenine nucleotide alpha hydrolases-like superfamily protein [Klebsormidium nitens]|uniref:Cytoplasmic tRNA 2-thiolation protein 2 n=1 Tax=Klebsormidium nitens TaxID=105231 RepID=A0A1Y1HUL3_KLENI|nr:Adenine nucleotide alpha hydrolases-like superfamily protein [Klebsormidium nitens]|eukprot:GAQ81522.1 Adenine nucleotide alpha hydrolases-like superfamily protein [Klebsormidium nitens]
MAQAPGVNGLCGGTPASCSSACDRHGEEARGMSANGASVRVTGDTSDGGGGGSGETAAREGAPAAPLCVKCRAAPAEVIANQREPYCGACLRASLLYKVKTAINKHALVQAHDAVLLAFSGGHSSTVLLHFLSELQSHATTPLAAAADRGKTVFRLGLVFVSEAAVLSRPHYDGDADVERIRKLAAPFEKRGCRVHVVRLEELFLKGRSQAHQAAPEGTMPRGSQDSATKGVVRNDSGDQLEEGRPGYSVPHTDGLAGAWERLRAMVARVADATAQEDLVEMLRTEALQQVAVEHGYTKIATGVCASRLAAEVLTGTVKGRGFSLPADLQAVDRRRTVPVIAPLRDCVIKELATLCTLNRWPTTFVPSLDAGPTARPSLNRLTQDFLTLIEDDLPGRTLTILRTAGKLQPFPFNAFPALPPGHRARLQPAQGTEAAAEPADGVNLCALCRAPLTSAEVQDGGAGERGARGPESEPGQRLGADAGDGGNEGRDTAEQARAEQAEERRGAAAPAGDQLRENGAEVGSTGGESDGRGVEVASVGHEASNGDSRGSSGAGRGVVPPGPQSEARPGGVACCRSCREQVLGGTGGTANPAWLHDLPWLDRAGGRAAEEARRDRMRNKIQDFLL